MSAARTNEVVPERRVSEGCRCGTEPGKAEYGGGRGRGRGREARGEGARRLRRGSQIEYRPEIIAAATRAGDPSLYHYHDGERLRSVLQYRGTRPSESHHLHLYPYMRLSCTSVIKYCRSLCSSDAIVVPKKCSIGIVGLSRSPEKHKRLPNMPALVCLRHIRLRNI
jgi:hypothetical protein